MASDSHHANTDSIQLGFNGCNDTLVSGTASGVPFGENDTLSNMQHSHNNGAGIATVDNLCTRFRIMPDAIAAAKCNVGDKDKSLVAMVLHHRAMVHILVTLGYHDQDNPFSKGKVVQFIGGLEFSAESILRSWDESAGEY
jgi:hypothetical protein